MIGQAACEVLPATLVAALKLSVGNFLEGKFRHFEEETQNSYSRIVPLVISKTHCQLFSAVGVV